MILFLGVKNEPNQKWLAYTSYCALDQDTRRPVAGFIIFNEGKVSYTNGDYYAQLSTFIHEVLHALFFHPTLFKTFPKNSNGKSFLFQDVDSKWKIRGDTILKVSRDYFDCQTLNGIPLENNGGSTSAGAHFEKIFFADEMMTPDDTLEINLSRFSLAVAKDSGFFQVNMDKGENIFWGKNEGCGFFEQSCKITESDEFCSKDETVSCSDNLMFRTQCHTSQFTNTCKINLHFESCKTQKKSIEVFEKYGRNSLCLNTIVKIIFILI